MGCTLRLHHFKKWLSEWKLARNCAMEQNPVLEFWAFYNASLFLPKVKNMVKRNTRCPLSPHSSWRVFSAFWTGIPFCLWSGHGLSGHHNPYHSLLSSSWLQTVISCWVPWVVEFQIPRQCCFCTPEKLLMSSWTFLILSLDGHISLWHWHKDKQNNERKQSPQRELPQCTCMVSWFMTRVKKEWALH